MVANTWFTLFAVFVILVVVQCQPTVTRTRTPINLGIPSDTPTNSPLSASPSPTSTATATRSPDRTTSPSISATRSSSLSASASISISPSSTKSPVGEGPGHIADSGVTPSNTQTPDRLNGTFNGGNGFRAVEFNLTVPCGGRCSAVQISIMVDSIADFLNINSTTQVDAVQIADGLVTFTVCSPDADELLNAIVDASDELSTQLLQLALITDDPEYLSRCPIVIEEVPSLASITIICLALSLFFTLTLL